MKYAIYNNDNIITLYEGDFPPIITPYIEISEADFNMAKSNPVNFKLQNNILIPLENQEYYLRIKRDFLLQQSDKYMLPDYPTGEFSREQWENKVKAYRQELRDFPSVCDIDNPAFPILST